MGYQTDYAIAMWREKVGIKPATGKRAELLRRISDAAFDAIKAIELELSGIRDGDGFWHGSDVMGAVTDELAALCSIYRDIDDLPNDAEGERNYALRDLARAQEDHYVKCLGEGYSAKEIEAAGARREQAIEKFRAADKKWQDGRKAA
jgi:hypothetical protein